MVRVLILAYGIAAYLAFVAVFLLLIAFVAGLLPGSDGDGPAPIPVSDALAWNTLLLVGFALQHSIMARAWWKRRWTRFFPAAIERSTYVLASAAALGAVLLLWRPIAWTAWHLQDPALGVALHAVQILGWLLVPTASILIDHAELFGLSQVWARFRNRRHYPPRFVTPGPYRIVRHPLYLGWLVAFWSTPQMSGGRLLFAGFFTAYVLLAIRWEERDLVRRHGWKYAEYRRHVPMLLPAPTRRRR